MKKKSIVFGKRQMVLALLAVVLAGAVYLNWRVGGSAQVSDVSSQVSLGDAQFVNAQANNSAYFTAARTERQTARADSMAELKEIAENKSVDEDARKEASEKSLALASAADTEASIESLIKAKGFKDCIAVIGTDGISVVVKSGDLLDSQIMQIKDIVMSQTEFDEASIKIMNVAE